MIVYFDTSAFLKLFLDEPGSDRMLALLPSIERGVTCLLTFAETRAALARAARSGALEAEGHREAVLRFEERWRQFNVIMVSVGLIRRAAGLAEQHALRGYDAVHLAAALAFREQTDFSLHFATWDRDLAKAAAAEGLEGL